MEWKEYDNIDEVISDIKSVKAHPVIIETESTIVYGEFMIRLYGIKCECLGKGWPLLSRTILHDCYGVTIYLNGWGAYECGMIGAWGNLRERKNRTLTKSGKKITFLLLDILTGGDND